jgi:glycosyltransferase involved in cell wall biosynthesis
MISILLATYNGEKFIYDSIKSVLNQTYHNFELLIGFNGTTDNSKNIVSSFNDDRIKIFDFGEDRGKAKTLNKLLNLTNHEWIAIQDDDDIWLDKKLERQIQFINQYDIIGTFIEYINSEGFSVGGPKLKISDDLIKLFSFTGNNQIANTSAIFKKNDALSIGGWDETLDGIEDFDFWLKLMRLNKKFINISEILVRHRIHNDSNFNTKKYDLSKIL